MKLLKIEKWWLIIGIILYAIYNIPGVPAYGDARGAIIWNILAFLLMWTANYWFNARVNKIYKPRKTTEQFLAENYEMEKAKAEAAARWDAQLDAERAGK